MYEDLVTLASKADHASGTPQPTTFCTYGLNSLREKEMRFKANKNRSTQKFGSLGKESLNGIRQSLDIALKSKTPFDKADSRFSALTRNDQSQNLKEAILKSQPVLDVKTITSLYFDGSNMVNSKSPIMKVIPTKKYEKYD